MVHPTARPLVGEPPNLWITNNFAELFTESWEILGIFENNMMKGSWNFYAGLMRERISKRYFSDAKKL